MDTTVDILIIGGGAAALSAAIFAARRNLATLVVMKDLGGQLATTDKIENYPGVEFSTGPDLARKFKLQAAKFGAQFVYDEISSCARDDGGFVARGIDGEYRARTVILAFGLTPRGLEVASEEQFWGKGIYTSPIDWLDQVKAQPVAVVGGGSAALQSALLLSDVAEHVTLIHRRDEFRGEEVLAEQVRARPNVSFLLNAVVSGLAGSGRLEFVRVKTSDQEINLPVSALFVNIGYQAKTSWLAGFVNLNERQEIIIDRNCATSTPGVFAAGDCTDISWKQIPISSGEGAKAAISAYQYLLIKDGKRGALTDWS